jgi:signal transduction histidine kinase
MPSRSPSASRSSTSGLGGKALVAAGLIGGGAALIVSGRRRRREAEAGARAAARREASRQRLQAQLNTAEQDERRRLALFLHDGPLQSLAGIALMHDAALEALAEGRTDDAAEIVASAVSRERETIQTLRDLSFAIEPVILRDRGLGAAVRELGDQIERAHGIPVALDLGPADLVGESARLARYQTIREGLNQAVRRRPAHLSVAIERREDGCVVAAVADDGVEERRRASADAIDERAAVAGGRTTMRRADGGGTVVLVTFPPYAAAV